jgi:hypothetical protein
MAAEAANRPVRAQPGSVAAFHNTGEGCQDSLAVGSLELPVIPGKMEKAATGQDVVRVGSLLRHF